MNLYLPGAAWRPITYRAEAGTFTPGQPIGWIGHVQVGNGSLWAYFEHAVSPNRKFSTAWVTKDGHSEQYTELNREPWAQGAGNASYHAFECEGYPNEPYTPAQINTLATWHNFLSTPDLLANAPGERGVGVHSMGGQAYGGHSCCGPVRQAQRPAIIARAQTLRGGKPLPPVPHPPTPTGRVVLTVDGAFGTQTRMRLQQWAGVVADSVLGPVSWAAIQRKVGVTADGNPGPLTWKAIQRLVGSAQDGIPGPQTYAALQRYLNAH